MEIFLIKRDGHIHTPFCPHGTKDTFSQYVEKAIELGLKEITFTEHAPLPKGFVDTTPTKDSAMAFDQLPAYLQEIDDVKKAYHQQITIYAGLEVDYLEGFEEETTAFLNEFGPHIDDAILSVHFLKIADTYVCVDYSPDVFEQFIRLSGSIEAVHENYYRTVLQSVKANLGPFKPKRIGHITLVNKFQRRFPIDRKFDDEIDEILDAMAKNKLALDYNGAGTAKPLCREPYPPFSVIKRVKERNIPLVYGSDAHQVKELGQGLDQMDFT